MIFFIESVVLCLVFTLLVVPSVYKNPMAWAADYPPAIRERLRELGTWEEPARRFPPQVLVRKILMTVLSVVLLGLLVHYVNGAQSFAAGFGISYGLWLVVAWYDALVLDCLWMAHSRKVRLPGTEDMEDAYHDYGFHLRMSGIGSLLGLPVCLLAGGLTALLSL